jgi:CHASE3 domain sensor protein
MRIATRLSITFGLLVALCALVGFVALRQLAVINQSLTTIVEDGNVKLAVAKDLSRTVFIGVESIQTMVIVPDKKAAEASVQRGLAAQQKFFKLRDELQRLAADSAEGKKLVATIFEVNDKQAEPDFGKFIQLAQAGKREEAGAWLVAKAGPSLQLLQDSIDRYIEFQNQENLRLQQEGASNYERAKVLLLGFVVLSLVLAGVMGMAVVRSVRLELGGEPSQARDLARLIS